jgi:hypothetical protein
MRKPALILITFLALRGPAMADFTLIAVPNPEPGANVLAEPAGPNSPASPAAEIAVHSKLRRYVHHALEKRKTPHRQIAAAFDAQGFGFQVPLDFAARQIAPSQVTIHYAPGVDSSALVDWKGGRLWILVLGDAVRPLGLAARILPRSVTIVKSAQSE